MNALNGNGNGPRVSFNRDVHVKRIGSRPTNDPTTSQQHNESASASSLRRELPTDLSEDALRKEAALVLKQAERIKCRTNGGSDIVGGRVNEKSRGKIERKSPGKAAPSGHNPHFNSLPTRGKKKNKPVIRSVSDVSAKKNKKPSLFNLFGRKSDQNLDKIDDRSSSDNTNATSKKKVTRSKSDVGTSKENRERRTRRKSASENEDSSNSMSKKKAQLSPIIEASPRDDYFVDRTSPPLSSPIKKLKEYKFGDEKAGLIDKRKIDSTNDSELAAKLKRTDNKVSGNIGYTNHEDLDLIPSKPIADSIKGTINTLSSNKHSKSIEEMHSSQLPPSKPRLTKGVTVDGLVKRLSMERFSPPPTDQAFSYTRPKDQIIYAQVVCNNEATSRNKKPQFESSLNWNHSSHNNQVTVNGKTMSKNESLSRQDVIDGVAKKNLRSKQNFVQEKKINYFGSTRDVRINSDEDEGLGFETKKELTINNQYGRSSPKFVNSDEEFKSLVDDTPIMPNIRNVAPDKFHMTELNYRGRGDGREFFPEFQDLSNRRENLESRIKSRIGSKELLDETQQEKERLKRNKRDIYREPERIEQIRRTLSKEFLGTPEPARRMKSMSPDRSFVDYHKQNDDVEVFGNFSSGHSHLETSSPANKHVQEKRYFDRDDMFKETYSKETGMVKNERTRARELRMKERYQSPENKHFLTSDEVNNRNLDPDSNYYPRKLNMKYENRRSADKVLNASPENTLQRQKKHQRSFDKGDSGIENDYRKDSFNNDLKIRKRRTIEEDIKASDNFLKRERIHTQDTHPLHFVNHFIYTNRERSIDDGSRFDPRLDKYVLGEASTLNRRPNRYPSTGTKYQRNEFKNEKKISGLEKVKQLFTGSLKKNKVKKDDKVLPHDQEVHNRYREYRGNNSDLHDAKVNDISSRRRLSTPKSSPVVTAKRAQSFLNRSSKSSTTSTLQQENRNPQKYSWFKSLDRLATRKKNLDVSGNYNDDQFRQERSKPRPLSPRNEKTPPKNLRFFGDTDLESNASVSKAGIKPNKTKKVAQNFNKAQRHISQSAYNLDHITDQKHQPEDIPDRYRSSSLQNLDEPNERTFRTKKTKNISRSRELHDISESLSDTDLTDNRRHDVATTKTGASEIAKFKQKTNAYTTTIDRNVTKKGYKKPQYPLPDQHRSYDVDDTDMTFDQKRHLFEDQRRYSPSRENSRERSSLSPLRKNYEISLSPNGDTKKPPLGPQKPARTFDRRRAFSREQERVHDSSGTEGESSQQSQRSVVYLHATTVGEIPSSYPTRTVAVSRAISREDLSAKKLQPMTRSISRSISVLAPWKPKHLSEGYEINYSRDDQRTSSTPLRHPHPTPTSSSTLAKMKKDKKSTTLMRSKSSLNKDDRFSEQSSSFNSASNRNYRNTRMDSMPRRK